MSLGSPNFYHIDSFGGNDDHKAWGGRWGFLDALQHLPKKMARSGLFILSSYHGPRTNELPQRVFLKSISYSHKDNAAKNKKHFNCAKC